MSSFDVYLLDSMTYEVIQLRAGLEADSIFRALDLARELLANVCVTPGYSMALEVVPAGSMTKMDMERRRERIYGAAQLVTRAA